MSSFTIALLLLSTAVAAGRIVLFGSLGRRKTVLIAATLLALLGLASESVSSADGESQPAPERPTEEPTDGYVTSRTCRACHPMEYNTWYASYHRRMTQVATPESVAVELDGVELALTDLRYRFERKDDQLWVEIQGRAGTAPERRAIVLTTGSHHRQWFWFASEDRKLGAIPFIYLIDEQRWVPREAAFIQAPRTAYMSAFHMGQWSASCIGCHTTRGEMKSLINGDWRVAEFGISCEACHGPAEEHVAINRDPQRRYEYYLGSDPDPTIVNPKTLPHRRSSEVCGQCHSVSLMPARSAHSAELMISRMAYRPGDDLAAVRDRNDREEPFPQVTRWPDGMMRTGGREYDSQADTPCFIKGEMECLSCHSMHPSDQDPRTLAEWADDQLAPGMGSDEACLQCHDRRTKLKEHTHHEPGSSGSRCYNCHMPYTNYALLKAIRNHQVAPPSAAATVDAGRPNACNLCHLNRSLGWTADWLEKWYSKPKPELSPDQEAVADSVLTLLSGHAGNRALVAWHLGWEPARQASGTGWMAPYLALLLSDTYPAVRLMAYRALRDLPGFEWLEYDYVGPNADRMAASDAVFKQWRETQGRSAVGGEPLLIDADGKLVGPELQRLLAGRDDRPINWIE